MINKLLDEAKEITGSDRQTALRLGFSPQFLYKVRAGTRALPTEAAARLGGILGRPEFQVICEVEAAQAKSARSRDYWATLKKRTVATAATILLAANVKAGMVTTTNGFHSSIGEVGQWSGYTLCEVRGRRKKGRFGRYGRRRAVRPRQMYWRFG